MSRFGQINRTISTHLAAAILSGVLFYGLAAETARQAIADERSTQQQLAIYAGCASKDPIGTVYWHTFPTAMDENGEPMAKPKKDKIVKVRQ